MFITLTVIDQKIIVNVNDIAYVRKNDLRPGSIVKHRLIEKTLYVNETIDEIEAKLKDR